MTRDHLSEKPLQISPETGVESLESAFDQFITLGPKEIFLIYNAFIGSVLMTDALIHCFLPSMTCQRFLLSTNTEGREPNYRKS